MPKLRVAPYFSIKIPKYVASHILRFHEVFVTTSDLSIK